MALELCWDRDVAFLDTILVSLQCRTSAVVIGAGSALYRVVSMCVYYGHV